MITLHFDAILQAVAIEDGDKQAIYYPKPASLCCIFRLTCQPRLFVWKMARLDVTRAIWRGQEIAVQS